MRAALRRRYSGIVGADPGKRPSVLLEHAGAWAYSLRSPSAVEGLLVLFPARANSPHRNFVRAYFFFILIESNTIITVRKDGSMARSCTGVGYLLFLCVYHAAIILQEAALDTTYDI